jgi:hypothetical protein
MGMRTHATVRGPGSSVIAKLARPS